jgi:hypothetical protein
MCDPTEHRISCSCAAVRSAKETTRAFGCGERADNDDDVDAEATAPRERFACFRCTRGSAGDARRFAGERLRTGTIFIVSVGCTIFFRNLFFFVFFSLLCLLLSAAFFNRTGETTNSSSSLDADSEDSLFSPSSSSASSSPDDSSGASDPKRRGRFPRRFARFFERFHSS